MRGIVCLRCFASDRGAHGLAFLHCWTFPGDNVAQCFYRVAADLAGVVLTKPELEVASKVVKAEIINHPQVPELRLSLPCGPEHGRSTAFRVGPRLTAHVLGALTG